MWLNERMGKLPLNDPEQSIYRDASAQKFNHLLDSKSRLFTCPGKLEHAGCYRCHTHLIVLQVTETGPAGQ